jgi:hypothetical protein
MEVGEGDAAVANLEGQLVLVRQADGRPDRSVDDDRSRLRADHDGEVVGRRVADRSPATVAASVAAGIDGLIAVLRAVGGRGAFADGAVDGLVLLVSG